MRLVVVAALAALLSACSDGGGTPVTPKPPTSPAPPAQVWPVVYDLASLKSPYMPGSVYTTPTTCNRVLRSSLESGTITLKQDNTADVYVRAWEERPSSTNAPGIPCPSFIMVDLSSTKAATYTIVGSGTSRSLVITIAGTEFASGPLAGASGFPATLALSVPGYGAFRSGRPFDVLQPSGWNKRP
ncbi:MAG: hypothetical protein AVDCRST_MAG89-3348 [uncultured Gemmatimonadetes bacterium]|uniref:Uncharacterized protein n=1 Tax=uncultured Gemmatimonadota bacterium TaxID=203437 RepID=A0A6J4MCK2_9BACT|nr:MAG: hypothetical protein AVDCRST_MAG89-3348 [uncultured Gemmatimonadota bacterium]